MKQVTDKNASLHHRYEVGCKVADIFADLFNSKDDVIEVVTCNVTDYDELMLMLFDGLLSHCNQKTLKG